ncbi:MAG: hypothetical protein ACREBE_04785 [bacterium]
MLEQNIRHHVHDEAKLLREVEATLDDDDDLAALGNQLLATFESPIESAPKNDVPTETQRAAELRV